MRSESFEPVFETGGAPDLGSAEALFGLDARARKTGPPRPTSLSGSSSR
ncbi:MAG: hypothetical protein U0230_23630 [Polyangiales bacterium]